MGVSYTTWNGPDGSTSREWIPAKWSIYKQKRNAMRCHTYFPIMSNGMEKWVEIQAMAEELGCARYFEREGKKGTVLEGCLLTLEVNSFRG